jgi:uncharacterized protein
MRIQTNVLWTGREYHSLEYCLVTTTEQGTQVDSVIVGTYENKIYRVEYQIQTNPQWETVFADIKSQHSDQIQHFRFESDGKGNWTTHGKSAPEFKGCIDIDIPLTPFTNTLPIKRLQLPEQTSREIQVIYFDLLAQEIKPVRQKYTRLSHTTYQYENIPNDFEAAITVDELGLVVDYPELFVRTASLPSNYP